mmetsp:Transcript_5700/g.20460  ORF Transcript_5700/g.20460 Transcript_5700/m.20460 type:complete len:413 (-) Transcript_5700:244-1482(-)
MHHSTHPAFTNRSHARFPCPPNEETLPRPRLVRMSRHAPPAHDAAVALTSCSKSIDVTVITTKPSMDSTVGDSLSASVTQSGIISRTITNSMAAPANARAYGSIALTASTATAPTMPDTGCTHPVACPQKNDCRRVMSSLLSTSAAAMPSGISCRPMAIVSDTAAPMLPLGCAAAANATPIASASGMCCTASAKTSSLARRISSGVAASRSPSRSRERGLPKPPAAAADAPPGVALDDDGAEMSCTWSNSSVSERCMRRACRNCSMSASESDKSPPLPAGPPLLRLPPTNSTPPSAAPAAPREDPLPADRDAAAPPSPAPPAAAEPPSALGCWRESAQSMPTRQRTATTNPDAIGTHDQTPSDADSFRQSLKSSCTAASISPTAIAITAPVFLGSPCVSSTNTKAAPNAVNE